MAILDILNLTLADSQLALEDPSTPLSCLWQDAITSISEKQGVLKVAWGRKTTNYSEIILFTAWVDKYCRDAFHQQGLGVRAINYYLKGPIKVRFAIDVEHFDMFVHGATAYLSINTKLEASPDGGINEGFVLASEKEILDVGELYRVEVLEDGKLRSVLEPAQLMIRSIEEPQEPIARHYPAWKREIMKEDQIPLRGFYQRGAYRSTGEPRPTQISHLFTRDIKYYGTKLPERPDDLYTTVDSPMGGREPPENSYRYPAKHQFYPDNGSSSSIPIPSQPNSPWETLVFTFKDIAPEHSDTVSEVGKRWRAYRKAIVCSERSGCLQVYVANYPDMPKLGYLFMQFDSLAYADPVYSTQAAATAFTALQPYLQSSPSRSVGLPFYPFDADDDKYGLGQKGEIVDFVLPQTASDIDRRALELYISHFLSVLATPWHTNEQIQAQPQGWVDPARMILRQTLPYSSTAPSNKFRVIFSYRRELHVELWNRIFVEDPYDQLGYRAHWIALLCQVQGKKVVLKRDQKKDFV